MNLFNVESDFIGKLDTKPRDATDNEVFAYLRWQRERRGLPDLNGQELHYAERKGGRRWERGHCLGATYGNQTARPEREQGRWKPAQYENGSYSLLMPGYAISRATVTMETLNDAGEVVASQTLPVEPKKGGVVWTKETVRAACGPVAKVAKPRKGRATPTAEPAGKAKRTAGHERAIRMAWAQRKARRRAEQVSRARLSDLITAQTCVRAAEAREAAALNDYRLANSVIADAMAATDAANARAAKAQEDLTVAEYAKGQLVRIIKETQAERDEAREWAALLEEENAALTRKPPALRLVA